MTTSRRNSPGLNSALDPADRSPTRPRPAPSRLNRGPARSATRRSEPPMASYPTIIMRLPAPRLPAWDQQTPLARRGRTRSGAQSQEGEIVTEDEIIDQAEALPERFADRLTESALWSVKRMRGGGEYGLLTIEIAASLAAHNMPVTKEERDELQALLEAMGMPTEPIGRLNVQGY